MASTSSRLACPAHVLVRDWHSKQKLDSFTLPGSNGIFVPKFLPGGEQFVVPSAKAGEVVIRDVHPSPAEVTLVGHEQAVKDVGFSPDGEQVFSISRDGTLRVWSALTGQELHTIQSHPTAFKLAIDTHGDYIATGGSDGAKLWSAESLQLIEHWRDTTDIWWIDFSPDGKRIVVESGPLGGNNVLSLFEVSSGRQLLSRETPRKIEGLVFCTDSRRAVSVMYGTGQLDLWDLDSGEARTFRMGFEVLRTLVVWCEVPEQTWWPSSSAIPSNSGTWNKSSSKRPCAATAIRRIAWHSMMTALVSSRGTLAGPSRSGMSIRTNY